MRSDNADTDFTPARKGIAQKLGLLMGFAALGISGLAVAIVALPGQIIPVKTAPAAASTAPAPAETVQAWVAAAPGRVEPRSGQVRLSAGLVGRVVSAPVKINDRVAEGQVLIQLEDKEARARLVAAEAEASARKRERDAQPATTGREAVNKAEDAVFAAQRVVTNARFELDEAIIADLKANGSSQAAAARRRLTEARDKLRQEHAAFASAHAKAASPAPNRLEAALAAARADVRLAETVLDNTRIRAPIAGSVLQVNARVGEMVAPAPDQPLLVMGDMSKLRVRAEIDEPDVSKIKLGQKVFVKNTAYPGEEFEGTVAELAPSLALPRMGSRGPRRTTDVEVMEVIVDLDGAVPLLPGMRVDAFFRR